jgi:hypothetical protein
MDKDNFGKNNNKIIWENTAIIHSVLRKKNYKAKLLISSILKKKHKKRGKNYVGNTIAIHIVL